MVVYICKYCNFSSKLKGDYNRHLKTKKHMSNVDNSLIPMVETQKDPQKTQQTTDKYYCEFCFDLFTTLLIKGDMSYIDVSIIQISINC